MTKDRSQDEIIDGNAKQREAGNQHAGNGARFEGDIEAGAKAVGCGLRGAQIGAHGNMHADKPGDAGQYRADNETDGRDGRQQIPGENGDDQSDDGDGEILTGEISLRTFTDKTCYFTHTLVALIGIENALGRPHRVHHGQDPT